VFLQLNFVEKEMVLYVTFIFLYEQKSNVHYSIEVSLKISTNTLQERIQAAYYQITRPYPILEKNVLIGLFGVVFFIKFWIKPNTNIANKKSASKHATHFTIVP
jgi:hypothetical protein